MFIPRRRLRWLVLLCLGLAFGSWLVLTGNRDQPSTPAWVKLGAGPPITYVDDYAQGVNISAQAAILVENATGTVLYAKNEHVRRAPASTTKVLTALLALETGRLDDVVTVSRNADATPGSTAALVAGQKLTLEEALHGLLLRSGNDAAVAIAEHLQGSVSEFAKEMNLRSKELGAANSQWKNPHGLDHPGHYTTAYDLAMISRVALLYPKVAEIVGTKNYSPQSIPRHWSNTNRLLWSYAGADGVKTGTTSQAGHCLVAAASRDGRQLISVVLGSSDRWSDSTRLLNYGFDNFHLIPIATKGQVIAELQIEGAVDPRLEAMALQDFSQVVATKDVEHLHTKVVLEPTTLPIKKGDELESWWPICGIKSWALFP